MYKLITAVPSIITSINLVVLSSILWLGLWELACKKWVIRGGPPLTLSWIFPQQLIVGDALYGGLNHCKAYISITQHTSYRPIPQQQSFAILPLKKKTGRSVSQGTQLRSSVTCSHYTALIHTSQFTLRTLYGRRLVLQMAGQSNPWC